MASNKPGSRRYHPSERALRALQLTYELQIVPTRAYDLIFGSKANRSEQIKALVEAGLLGRIPDPIRRPGPPSHYYAVTPEAYRFLRQVPTGSRRPPAVTLTAERILAPGTAHLLAAGAFALACLYGLPASLAPDWHGEPSARMTLTPDKSGGPPGTYVEPDGVLLLATGEDASDSPAVFYECDWGSEHAPKWKAKIGRYARAAAQRAHASRYGEAWPPLLVTCRTPESLAEIAEYLARGVAAERSLWGWAIWLACYDDVAAPERIDSAAWRQVRPAVKGDPLYEPVWALVDILEGYSETPYQAELREIQEAQQRQAAARAREAADAEIDAAFWAGAGSAAEERRRQDEAARADAERRRLEAAARAEAAAIEREIALARERSAAQVEAWQAEAKREAARRQEREDALWQLAGIGGAVLAGIGLVFWGIPTWVDYWWYADPRLPALWADPNGVLVFQLVTTFSHVSVFALLAPFVLAAGLLLGWLRRKYRGW